MSTIFLFFLSGLTELVYQTLWVKQLALVVKV
jgi:hypothetical protein